MIDGNEQNKCIETDKKTSWGTYSSYGGDGRGIDGGRGGMEGSGDRARIARGIGRGGGIVVVIVDDCAALECPPTRTPRRITCLEA
jgi:hypothetical protein